jgi:hypothetical protein
VKRVTLAALLLLSLGLFVASAVGQLSQVPLRQVIVDWSRKFPAVSYTAQDFADNALRQRLKSGLPQTFVTRIYAYREKEDHKPIAVSVLSCRVVYDLWEELFRIRLQSVQGSYDRIVPSTDAVARLCLNPRNISVGSANDYARSRNKALYFGVIIEFNPMSDRVVERIRRWIASSGGEGKLTGDGFFGSFVSIFVDRRMGSAERSFRFRSPLMWMP